MILIRIQDQTHQTHQFQMEFQTVSSLYTKLKLEDPKTPINVSLDKTRFGIVTFVDESHQEEVWVKKTEAWNFVDFTETSEMTPIGDVLNWLSQFLEAHAENPVLFCGKLIKDATVQPVCVIEKIPNMIFYQTSLNLTNRFRKEFETAYETVLKEDQELLLTWLRKKIPQNHEPVYLIDNLCHFGAKQIKKDLGEVLFDKIFVQDSKCSKIYVSKLGLKKVKMLSGTLSVEEKLTEFESWIE